MVIRNFNPRIPWMNFTTKKKYLDLHSAFVKRFENIPRHVAFIMDGNGRWAREHGFHERMSGHEKGSSNISELVISAGELGIEYMTFYTFSTENWSRPRREVEFILLDLLRRQVEKELPDMMKRDIKFNVIGNLEGIPKKTRDSLASVADATKANTGVTTTLAVNYGGRQEILEAFRRYAHDAIDDPTRLDKLDEDTFRHYLYDPELPDPDLLIRTGGDMRISNFFLWQMSYTEIYVTDVLWPDFGPDELYIALDEYNKRQRRFGAVP